MIEEYQFGYITIGGKCFDFDIEITSTGKTKKWQREKPHLIDIEDVQEAVRQKPEILVIGTGAYGLCKITSQCQKFIIEQNIKLIIDNTKEAVKAFNTLLKYQSKENFKFPKIIGLFHLTC